MIIREEDQQEGVYTATTRRGGDAPTMTTIQPPSQELKKVLIKIHCIKKCLLDLDPI
jgi:hypothetical protein